MREIKFRGIRKDNGERVYGSLIQYTFLGEHICSIIDNMFDREPETFVSVTIRMRPVIPETVGQFTGLKDKKRTKEFPEGQEIYGEGDIYKDAEGVVSVVKMAVDGWALFPVIKGTVRNLYWHNVCIHTQGEVIGNKWDNPELLGENNGNS